MTVPRYDAGPLFVSLLRRFGIPEPVREYRFEPSRRWRFDYAWPAQHIALEVDGGLFNGGRHVRGAAILKTHEKLNQAAVLGWRVLYTTPDRLTNLTTIKLMGDALGVPVDNP